MKVLQNHLVISIDPGESVSGVALIMVHPDDPYKSELTGFVEDNVVILNKITESYVKYNPTVIVEDIRPYSVKMSNQIINTCKFIGELNYRLKTALQLDVRYTPRGTVKKWVFEQFNRLCIERIDEKIAYLDAYGERKGKKRYRNKDGGIRKASFHWVDDRIVIAAMKELWKIPTPKPGKKNIYGFSSHSWNALAVGTHYLGLTPQV